MMSAEGEVKLTDFGIAKAQNKTEKSLGNLIKGKVAFMSPEQAAGGELDGRSDLFSVGTMLYAMITRRHPVRRADRLRDADAGQERRLPAARDRAPRPQPRALSGHPQGDGEDGRRPLPESGGDAGRRRAGHARRLSSGRPDGAAALAGRPEQQGRRADADTRGAARAAGLALDGRPVACGVGPGVGAGVDARRRRGGSRVRSTTAATACGARPR